MPAKLYVIDASHPCRAVKRAFELKGIPYRTVEFPPSLHFAFQRAKFGSPTVPGVVFEGGEKLQGSSAIMRRLDELAPEPRLYPDERVAEAEAWGESVLQAAARRILWVGFARAPRAMAGFQGGKLPALPRPVIRAMAPVVTRVERRVNQAPDAQGKADLQALPAHLDKVDAWIADGVLGGDPPNAADLQIASSLGLLMTVGDVRPLIAGRPCAELATRLFPYEGELPAGTFPADWLPASPAGSSLAGSPG